MNTLENGQNQIGKPLVCVWSITYNHAPYIADAMNGFCMQQTSFPFVCAVIDDCSTDGEQEVISNYLHEHFDLEDQSVVRNEETDDYKLIYARHKENHNCFFVVLYLKYNHYSIGKSHLKNQYIKEWYDSAKYIALCEGDDYWIDPLKLQKQVDYMENHPECGLVHTKHKCLNNETGEFIEGWAEETNFDKNLIRNRICTLTACFRRDLYVRYLSESFPREQWPMGDAPLWLYIMAHSSSKLLCDETGVYRILTESASHSNNINKNIEFLLGGYEMKLFFIKKYEKYEFQKNNAQYVVKELKRLSYLYNKNINFNFLAFLTKNDIFDLKLYLSTFATHSSFLRFVINKLKH